ncbi:superoxide dismutase [Brevundimonas sp.]|uniref:superoxide dismutase n=1 Tax=Brevundimonas sp. TaxID=1871086 RepID=UPI002FC70547
MIRKAALLYSMTGAMMIAAPALAQEQPQDMATPPAPAEAAAAPQSLTLNPGATVKSADGSELGKLVGAQNGANGQELTVRGADGIVRAIALNGIRQEGSDIVVNATLSDFQSAAPIAGQEPATDAATADDADADTTADTPADEPKA